MVHRYWPCLYRIWRCGSEKSILSAAVIGYQPWYECYHDVIMIYMRQLMTYCDSDRFNMKSYHILGSDNRNFAHVITLEKANRYWPFCRIWLCGSGKSILPGADIGYQPWYWVLPWRHQELCASLPISRWRLIDGDR